MTISAGAFLGVLSAERLYIEKNHRKEPKTHENKQTAAFSAAGADHGAVPDGQPVRGRAFAEEVTPAVVTTDGNDQPTTPVTPDEGQTTPANADKSGGETPAPANGDANAEPVPAEGEVTPPAVAVPKLKDGVSPTASATVQTGTAYLLSDLQAGKIFDGEGLTYENYYYERSADNGQSWGAKQKFEKALFGGTLIQLTETVAGTYIYRFYASFDGENFSTDTWTLTLTVEDNPTMEFSFFVGKDYNGGYPVIKLYNCHQGCRWQRGAGRRAQGCVPVQQLHQHPCRGRGTV